MKKEPVRRNWLDESYRILKGENISCKKEHIEAMAVQLKEFSDRNKKLLDIMNNIYLEVRKRRIAEGKPVPPHPGAFIGIPRSS
jgi:hypothetical protein